MDPNWEILNKRMALGSVFYFLTLIGANVVLTIAIAVLVLCNVPMTIALVIGIVVSGVPAGMVIYKCNKYLVKKFPFVKNEGDKNGHT
jgi:hypothetical protein